MEILPPETSALEVMQRAEVDVQIATAHRYPRSMSVFKKRALDMALIDTETAESCIYCRPVGKKNGKEQYAEGLSVRLAEIVGASYGNVRVGSMIIEQTPRQVKARGYAHDLESNFASTSEVVEPTVTKNGDPYSENMRAVVAKAALAKAWRDALFKVVPRALCKPIEVEVRKLAAGDAKSLGMRRSKAMEWVNKLGIDTKRVFTALGIAGEEDLTSEHLLTLTGLKTAIKEGDTTIDDAFPEVKAATPGPKFGKTEPEPAKEPDVKAETKPAPIETKPPVHQTKPADAPQEADSDQVTVTKVLENAEIDFETFRGWLGTTGRVKDPDSIGSFDDVPAAVYAELCSNKFKALAKCVTIYGVKA